MPIKTILIDDHRLFNDGLSLVLRDSPDFVVAEQIYDSRLAFEACLRHTPDLVLVDVNMPHLDGLAVVEQLQQLPVAPKVVIISMYADQREIARFSTLVVNGYIAKTVTADRLLTLLGQVMAGQYVLETDTQPRPERLLTNLTPPYNLTKRELDILKQVKRGLTSEQIADELHLSFYTVQTHRKNISQKLPFTTRKEFYDFLRMLD